MIGRMRVDYFCNIAGLESTFNKSTPRLLKNRVVNLGETDIKEARDKAHKHCPGIVAPRVSLNALRALRVSNTTKQSSL